MASYDTLVFLSREGARDIGGRVLDIKKFESSSKKAGLFWILAASLVLAILALSLASAQADPANTRNQATFVHFSGKTTFGVPPAQQSEKISKAAIARLKELERMRRLRLYILTARKS